MDASTKIQIRKVFETRVLKVMKTGDLPDGFDLLAREIFLYQMRECPAVAAYARVRLGPAPPRTWKEIPALPLEAFKLSTVRTFPESETVATFHTSGTTGEKRGQHAFATLDLYAASVVEGWRHASLPKLPMILLLPTPMQMPESSLAAMFDILGRELSLVQRAIWEPGHRVPPEALHTAREALGSGPVLIAGTALALLHLLERDAKHQPLPEGSWVLETGGYKSSGRDLPKESLYALITKKFGVPPERIINEYGMTEISSQFYARGLDQPHQGPPWMRATVIDPRTGQEAPIGGLGVLRIVDLANVGSAIAIETRDLAVRAEEGFFLVGRDPSALPRGCSRLMENAR